MRLYCKLAFLALLAIGAQTFVSRGVASDAYFTARCYLATAVRDHAMEERLIHEYQAYYVAQRSRAIAAASASNTSRDS